jgi:hypothetical protein
MEEQLKQYQQLQESSQKYVVGIYDSYFEVMEEFELNIKH